MLMVAEIVTVDALRRKESRGGHFRADYPTTGKSAAVRSRFTYDDLMLTPQERRTAARQAG